MKVQAQLCKCNKVLLNKNRLISVTVTMMQRGSVANRERRYWRKWGGTDGNEREERRRKLVKNEHAPPVASMSGCRLRVQSQQRRSAGPDLICRRIQSLQSTAFPIYYSSQLKLLFSYL